MCVVSMIGDHFGRKWDDYFPKPQLLTPWPVPTSNPWPSLPPTREEFDKLKGEVEEMKALLIKAKEYDEKHNEPHCEVEEKMEKLRKIAELVGISLDDVIGKKQ